jgi:hypothetical protein
MINSTSAGMAKSAATAMTNLAMQLCSSEQEQLHPSLAEEASYLHV